MGTQSRVYEMLGQWLSRPSRKFVSCAGVASFSITARKFINSGAGKKCSRRPLTTSRAALNLSSAICRRTWDLWDPDAMTSKHFHIRVTSLPAVKQIRVTYHYLAGRACRLKSKNAAAICARSSEPGGARCHNRPALQLRQIEHRPLRTKRLPEALLGRFLDQRIARIPIGMRSAENASRRKRLNKNK